MEIIVRLISTHALATIAATVDLAWMELTVTPVSVLQATVETIVNLTLTTAIFTNVQMVERVLMGSTVTHVLA